MRQSGPAQISSKVLDLPSHSLTAAKFPTNAVQVSEASATPRLRDLLPLSVPELEGIEFKGSRSVKRRLLRGSHASGIVRDSIVALNTLAVGTDSAERANSQPLTAAQEDVIASLKLSAQRLGAPPEDMHGEGALKELFAKGGYSGLVTRGREGGEAQNP